KSLSAPCSISSTRAILSSVIVFFSRFEFASEPYQKIDGGHPLRETFLHHPVGHDHPAVFGLRAQLPFSRESDG
ncbi:hypothetical protein, partial [Novosphingobium resinovorum]|uniref:hypothetical protein n=1 Tax=Novosphingobium resinovorum TaxID=158500 RepID=UPI0005632DAE